jgi:hypothetical protein
VNAKRSLGSAVVTALALVLVLAAIVPTSGRAAGRPDDGLTRSEHREITVSSSPSVRAGARTGDVRSRADLAGSPDPWPVIACWSASEGVRTSARDGVASTRPASTCTRGPPS